MNFPTLTYLYVKCDHIAHIVTCTSIQTVMHGVINPTKGPLDPMPSFGAYLTLISIVLLQHKTILELETSFGTSDVKYQHGNSTCEYAEF